MRKTTNKFAPEVGNRAVWMLFDHERSHPCDGRRWFQSRRTRGSRVEAGHKNLRKASAYFCSGADRPPVQAMITLIDDNRGSYGSGSFKRALRCGLRDGQTRISGWSGRERGAWDAPFS